MATSRSRQSRICKYSRKHDKRCGRENDLTADFVLSLIESGCAYCGSKLKLMTLDRIDNRLGHLKTNVVPACLNCNKLRGSMQYMEWLMVIKKIHLCCL